MSRLAHGEKRNKSGKCLCDDCYARRRENLRRYRASAKGQEATRRQTQKNRKPSATGWPVRVMAGRQNWLIARTCVDCGVLRMANELRQWAGKYGSTCKPCDVADRKSRITPEEIRRHNRRYREANKDKVSIKNRMLRDAVQQRTRAVAHRSNEGLQWTGPELELVATRDDLALEELALMLGRTYAAVSRKRAQVRGGRGMEPIVAGVVLASRSPQRKPRAKEGQ